MLKLKGLWIPQKVLSSENYFTLTEVCLVSFVASFKKCYLSNQQIAEVLKIRAPTVANIISSLRKRDLVSSHYEAGVRILTVSFKNENAGSFETDEKSYRNDESSEENETESFKNEHMIQDTKNKEQKHNTPVEMIDELNGKPKRKKGGAAAGVSFSQKYGEYELFLNDTLDKISPACDFKKLYWALAAWSNKKVQANDKRGLSVDWITVAATWYYRNPKSWNRENTDTSTPFF